jgi:hypothetical protein
MNEQLRDRDIVILEDHPDYKETVAGIPMSNGRYCILFAQRLSRMNRFSRQLKKPPTTMITGPNQSWRMWLFGEIRNLGNLRISFTELNITSLV